jgi:CRISPR-associated protein Cas6/Cse3/CasE subtype I-E
MRPLNLSELQFTRVLDVYRLHQLLKESAPDDARILFRAEVVAAEGELPFSKLLVQTEDACAWKNLQRHLRVEPRVKQASWDLAAGRSFRFRLRANVTAQRKGRNEPSMANLSPEEFRRRRGKRVAIWDRDEQLVWLTRKAEAGGFEIAAGSNGALSAIVGKSDSGALVFTSREERAQQSNSGRRLSFDGVMFDGHLRVKDPALFEQTLRRGIGPGKGFGFGLLSLASPT